jgi:hypothetical protein
MIKQCQICNKDFKTYPSRLAMGRGKYCSRLCSDKITLIKPGQHIAPATEIKSGSKPHNYVGRRFTKARQNGKKYILIHSPSHPYTSKSGYVREHRLIMESKLGRFLMPDEIVHHINGDTLDNRIDNLEVMPKVEHDRMNVTLNIHRRWYA